MRQLFQDLIKVSIGRAACLSRTPKVKEWASLYEMAKKQSLVGICFAGVQKLQAQRQAPNSWGNEQGELLYLQWMGMAAKIQQRNEVVNKQCALLGEKLESEGYSYCVLKGQGVAHIYPEHLRGLRQSGDIDVWVSGGRDEALTYVQKVSPTRHVTWLHADLHVFEDTAVEVHFLPTYLRCPWKNRMLKAWFDWFADFETIGETNGYSVPLDEFNLVFLALHIFRHLLGEGVGMRQLMDYYFVLNHVDDKETRSHAYEVLRSLGLGRFAGALMWICNNVFGLPEDRMICQMDKELGQLILKDIELTGNFGQHDDRMKDGESAWQRFVRTNATNLRYLRYFPAEVLCTPLYRVWHRCWQWKHGYV